MRSFEGLATTLLFIGLAFSGCFGDASESASDSGTDGDGSDTGNETANVTVVASIIVLVDGTETKEVNGTIHVVVGANVTFDGSNSTGPNLTFAWDFGDDASGANATEIHAYAKPGLVNVTLTVASGNSTDTASVALNVSAGGPSPGDLVYTDKKEFSGTLPLGNPNTATSSGVDYRDHIVEIKAVTPDGTPAMAKVARIVLDGSGPATVDMHLYWRSPSGTNLASATTSSVDETIKYEGDMPPGNYVVRVRLFAGVNASYTVKAEIDYMAT